MLYSLADNSLDLQMHKTVESTRNYTTLVGKGVLNRRIGMSKSIIITSTLDKKIIDVAENNVSDTSRSITVLISSYEQ